MNKDKQLKPYAELMRENFFPDEYIKFIEELPYVVLCDQSFFDGIKDQNNFQSVAMRKYDCAFTK